MKPALACPRCQQARPCECGYELERAQTKNKIDSVRYSKNRPGHRNYNLARWRHPESGLRACILRRDPVCKHCNRQGSTRADHIVDHRGDEKLFWDPANLQGLCEDCHNIKTFSTMASRRADAKPNMDKPGIVDGKVVDHAPQQTNREIGNNTGFDYLAALNKGKPSR
jgi:5-methylcytosine-specific restriction endonuclease McrA